MHTFTMFVQPQCALLLKELKWYRRCQSIARRCDSIKRAFCMWRDAEEKVASSSTNQVQWPSTDVILPKLWVCVSVCSSLAAHTIKINWSAWACWENPALAVEGCFEEKRYNFLPSRAAADAKWKGVGSWVVRALPAADVVFPLADSGRADRITEGEFSEPPPDTLEQVVRESFGAMPNVRDKTHNQTQSESAKNHPFEDYLRAKRHFIRGICRDIESLL